MVTNVLGRRVLVSHDTGDDEYTGTIAAVYAAPDRNGTHRIHYVVAADDTKELADIDVNDVTVRLLY